MSEGRRDRLVAILDLFTEDRLEWRPEEMMAHLGYTRPTLYRYLRTLREAGLLSSLPGSGFTLGPRVTELDFLMRRSDPLLIHGAPELDRISRLHPCTALLVRWYGQKLLCVASVVTADAPRSSYPRGRPMPLGRGAVSRAILAHLPRRGLEALVTGNLAEFSALGTTVGEVLAALREVRRQGHAIGRGEVTPGVVGLAVPVFDAGNAPVAALAVTTDEAIMTPQRIAATVPELRAAAERIGAALTAT